MKGFHDKITAPKETTATETQAPSNFTKYFRYAPFSLLLLIAYKLYKKYR